MNLGDTMDNCLFCKIASGQISADIVVENERGIAFRDISPEAPTHVLVIPREHHDNVVDLAQVNPLLAGELLALAGEVVNIEGLTSGYRIVTNTGFDGGQSVNHLHFHVLGGRGLTWPPG